MATATSFDGAPKNRTVSAVAAEWWIDRGYFPVPVAHRKKRATSEGWQNLRIGRADVVNHFIRDPLNIGVLLGDERGSADVDLDCREAIQAAPEFLPPTGLIFGRKSKPASHWFYLCDPPIPSSTFRDPVDNRMIVELRCQTSGGGIGLQTVVPPSTHESGEQIQFELGCDRNPIVADSGILKKAVGRIAAAALLALHWPKEGSRHKAFLALAGVLSRDGWSTEDRCSFFRAVYRAIWGQAADLDACKREAESTSEKHADGAHTTGYPTLADLIDPVVLDTALRWITNRASSPSKEDGRQHPIQELKYVGRPYVVHEGRLFAWKHVRGNNAVSFEIANFSARITSDEIVDDGVEQTRVFGLEANLGGRRRTIEIPAKDFKSLNWVTEKLGPMAIINPGQTEHVRTAIQMLSGDVPTRHVYSSTGWRIIDGANHYVHAGGAIGPSGNRADICVSLGDKLPNYCLPDPATGTDLIAAIRGSLEMLNVTLDRLTFPVYAAIWRSILGAANFSLCISGSTGAGKSQLSALAQQHFGRAMDADNLPASWLGTANATGTLAFYAKDALLVVDDFVPTGNVANQQKLHSEADRLLRGQGNSAGRRRLSSDGRLLGNRPPRGLILSTGEEAPRGKSLNARLVLLHLPKGVMDWTKLTIAQEMADKGEFAKVTSCFVQWLSPRLTNVREAMWEQKFRRRRESEPNGVHMRTPENLNALRFGLMTFLEFTQSVGAISQREAEGLIDRAAEAFREIALGEVRKHMNAEPAIIFLKLLRSAITMGRAYLAAPNGAAPDGNRSFGWYIPTGCREKESRGVKVGWVKGDDIFLLPDAARAVAHKLAQDQGEILPGSVETIKRDLKEQGLLARFDEKRRTITVRRTLEGEQQDVLVISYDTFQRTSCETADNADIADEQSLN